LAARLSPSPTGGEGQRCRNDAVPAQPATGNTATVGRGRWVAA